MDAALRDYHEHVRGDVLGHIEGVTSRAMFGGYGLYLDGTIFGIITAPGELRFRVDESNRAQYETLGSTPFIYEGHRDRKPTVMQYYLVPEKIQDDRDALYEWLMQSVETSRRAKRTRRKTGDANSGVPL